MPKLSVIVPVYKAQAYLDECITSILGQTFRDFEVILVDDGSPDNSPAMCDAWAQKDSRIRVIHKQNGGVSSARNAGLEAISQDSLYFTFVDSDDTLDKDCYRIAFDVLNNTAYDVFSFGISVIDSNGVAINKITCDSFSTERMADIEPHLINYMESSFYAVYSKLYAADILRKSRVRFNEGFNIGEDSVFNFQFFSLSNLVYHSSSCLYNYWQRDNLSLARRGDLGIYQMAFKRKEYYLDFLEQCGFDTQKAAQYAQLDIDMCAYSQFYQLINPKTNIGFADRYKFLRNMYRDAAAHTALMRQMKKAGSGIGVLLGKISIATKQPWIALVPSRMIQILKGL